MVKTGRIFCKSNASQLAVIGELIEIGKLEAHVATVLPLAEIKTAFRLSESGRTRGKIVMRVGA